LSEVDRISNLISDLKDDKISVEKFDQLSERQERSEKRKAEEEQQKKEKEEQARVDFGVRKEKAQVKVDEIMLRKKEKDKAREKYKEYMADESKGTFVTNNTDYAAWELFCPSDDEDEMISSLTPDGPQFKAMEKDMDDRHKKMKEKLRTAAKMKDAGNKAFKAGQFAESYRLYDAGLDADKRVVELQANAAMASLKIGCPVQAIEHCDQVFRIAEFYMDRPDHPLIPKTYQRRATAHRMLKHYKLALADFERAVALMPEDKEVKKQLVKAKAELEEHKREREIKKQADKEKGLDESNLAEEEAQTLQTLGQVEKLVQIVKPVRPRKHETPPPPQEGGEGEEKENETEPNDTDRTSAEETASTSAEDCEKRLNDVRESCTSLQAILQESEDNRIYFRACNGLQALAGQFLGQDRFIQNLVSGCKVDVLKTLTFACYNERNQEELLTRELLIAVMTSLRSDDKHEAMEAVTLLHTATSTESYRKIQSAYLKESKPALTTLLSMMVSTDPLFQANAVGLLANCALEKSLRKALLDVEEGRKIINMAVGLLTHSIGVIAEGATNLLANLCGDTVLRQHLAEHEGAVKGLLRAFPPAPQLAAPVGLGPALDKSKKSKKSQPKYNPCMVPAALAALNNCLLSEQAKEAVVAEGGVPRIVPLLDARERVVFVRSAQALARAVRKEPGLDELLAGDAISKVVAGFGRMKDLSTTLLTKCASDDSRTKEAESHMEAVEAVVRLLAVCTNMDARAATLLEAAGGLKLLLEVLGDKASSDAAVGNAALCVADSARDDAILDTLAKLDAVPPLIEIAHKRKGACNKNAGIALARMARNQQCLARLKELHGIEIMHHYVKQ